MKNNSASVVLFDNIVAAKLAGMTYTESESSSKNIAEKAIKSYRRFGHDDVTIIYGIRGFALALGSKVKYSDNISPAIVNYVLDAIEEHENLDYELGLYENDYRQQMLYRAIELITKELGGEAGARFCICAPFTAAAGLISPEKLLKATRKNKPAIHSLLRKMTDLTLRMIDKFAEIEQIVFHISDPVASGSLISPRQYQEFCQPYVTEVIEYIHSYNKSTTMHICGDTTNMLHMIADTDVDCFSLDQIVDLEVVKNEIGKKVTLLGNVDPVEVFLKGTPSTIEAAVDECFLKAGNNPSGFVIGPGCDLPYDTPIENIEAFMKAARKHF